MTPAALADWLAAIRTASPTLSLAAVEVLLRVAAGADNRREIEELMEVDRATITRSLGLLRGRAKLKAGRWRESPIELLQTRPHPHIAGALCYSLTQNGSELIRSLTSPEPSVHPCSSPASFSSPASLPPSATTGGRDA
jgi:hypothetical protein